MFLAYGYVSVLLYDYHICNQLDKIPNTAITINIPSCVYMEMLFLFPGFILHAGAAEREKQKNAHFVFQTCLGGLHM